ncbi:MAG: Rpn family recombination-promoting nuclease/putative transposase [Tannerellaceae bacterium]|jgi:predicted transposase/invertase (TIGR01784 family)|nr:Rpn family recombination-promoting nuclease/putative transposase [Tannerellaceae bacterium]
MAHYLDPKNDFIFKRIFGNHPGLLISFLNALMPFEPGRRIESIEYLANEMVPDNPLKKLSIVDVRCRDNYGRQFIVEMQMEWSSFFLSRMLFNASKTYVQQLNRKEKYTALHPVYALGILNDKFDNRTDEFYHRYQMINRDNTSEVIEGIEVILVELSKFKAGSWPDRRMAVLWLRFLKELDYGSTYISGDLLDNEDIRQAAVLCEMAGLTEADVVKYDQYWDAIRSELTLIDTSRTEGEMKGIRKGIEEGRREGIEEGRKEGERTKTVQTVINCAERGISHEDIAAIANIALGDVTAIIKEQTGSI